MSLLKKINCLYIQHDKERVYQGDIYKDIVLRQFGEQENDELSSSKTNLEYCVVLTQDCDLQQDFNDRSSDPSKQNNYLPSILLCPAYPAQAFKSGEHIENQKMKDFNSSEFSKIKNNDAFKRYHWLPEAQNFCVPELILDFKHYYTVPREIFYTSSKEKYLATVDTLFRENLSCRFCTYLSRIGLPEIGGMGHMLSNALA